ncbi:MAG: GlsB/YeaQ/YmgE family stress response membrane protein [Thermoanaerobaculia bacterium]
MGFFWFVVIGAVAGWYTGRRGVEGAFGPLGDIVLGTVGGLIGGFIARTFGFTGTAGVVVGVIMAGGVAAALVLALRKYSRRNVHAAVGVRDKTGRRRR